MSSESTAKPRVIGPNDGKYQDLGSLGVRFIAWTHETGGRFSVVEHPIRPRTLAAPLHRHSNEDEYSYVLEGNLCVQLGDHVVDATVGDFVFKPRNEWHAFWNPGDTPCRILEIISPGGFEYWFDKVGDLMVQEESPNPIKISQGSELAAKYGIEFKPESIQMLCEKYNLNYPN